MEKPTLISLYSGCGGSALGFQNAGFEITFMNDNNADACETLRENFQKTIWRGGPERGLVKNDNISENDIKKVFAFGTADIIEGGFPCQGFSLAGPRKAALNKNRSKNRHFRYVEVDDKRNALYNYLKRAITFANPKFFVAENVKGFVSIGEKPKKVYNKKTKRYSKRSPGPFFKHGKVVKLGKIAAAIIGELESTGQGYRIEYQVLNAKDYGLPQNRERIFIVGVRGDIDFEFKFPIPTHGPNSPDKTDYVSMEDYGVNGIPNVADEVFKEKKEYQEDYFSSRYMSRNRIKKWDDVSFTIPADATMVPADPSCKKMWNTEDGKPPGKNKVEDKEWTTFRKQHGNDIASDLVRMSWKQCAAIQGFPKDYKFSGNVKSIYRQIGNAVPPLMMQKIAECIKPYFEGEKSSFPMRKEKITA